MRASPGPIRSILPPMTRDELLARFAMEPNPSPAIRDADIEGALALTNRVGHVTSPYMERSLDAAAASRGLPWHQAEPGWLQEAVRNIQDEVGLMVCIALCLNTAPGLVRTPVPARGPGARTRPGAKSFAHEFVEMAG